MLTLTTLELVCCIARKATARVKLKGSVVSRRQDPVTHVTPTLMGSRSSVRHVELDQGQPIADDPDFDWHDRHGNRVEHRSGQ
jgi:hypothetical protein